MIMQHSSLTPQRWFTIPSAQQLIMIANELNRAGHWIAQSQAYEAQMAYERCLELLDLTISDPKWNRGRKELMRSREVVGMLYLQGEKDHKLHRLLQDAVITLDPQAYNLIHTREPRDKYLAQIPQEKQPQIFSDRSLKIEEKD